MKQIGPHDDSGSTAEAVALVKAYHEPSVVDYFVNDRVALYNSDCVEVARGLPGDSIGYSIFSPPFASLYTYSNSPRDMGNVRDYAEFFEHFGYLVRELFRVTKPGRLCSFHCMLLPTSKATHGEIGLRDFRGDLIRAFVAEEWIHHSEVVIWKDPVTAMQRTKALGLLHKQIKKDSCMSRQGIPDYLVTMRKPGANVEADRVSHTGAPGDLPVTEWQRLASPVWMDINPSDTLQYQSAREHDDERHICPLQLEVIRRALKLWAKAGDTVLSPFLGIGSEGFCAVEHGCKFVGAELKGSYFKQAVANVRVALAKGNQGALFDLASALGTTGAQDGAPIDISAGVPGSATAAGEHDPYGDLLSACRSALARLTRRQVMPEDYALQTQLEAAIAKAEGRAS
jgi:hypothetical protein